MSDSLEILEHIKNAPAFKGGDSRYKNIMDSATQYDADIEQIRKDLEILKMLRPHLINAGIGMFDNVKDNEIFHLKLTFSGEEYKQIERWLENDKG